MFDIEHRLRRQVVEMHEPDYTFPYVACNMEKCAYNSKGKCCKSAILVNGKTAISSTETNCESYKKTESHLEKNLNNLNGYVRVHCDVKNCRNNLIENQGTFNACRYCKAFNIKIEQVKDINKTICKSFTNK